jgi:hypothetical protein
MRHATITGARLVDEGLRRGGRRVYPVMITLTYALDGAWSRRHIVLFLSLVRDWFRRRGRRFHYAWVAELTERGRVHFHIVVWMPKGFRLPKPDKCGWWCHGMTKIEAARNAVGYLAKYVSKETLRQRFPKGLRIHGRGGLTAQQRIVARWWSMPKWLRDRTGKPCDLRRVVGGGVVCLETGEFFESPWRIEFRGGRIFAVLRRPMPRVRAS